MSNAHTDRVSMGSASVEGDYVLGTHDEEIARLGLQHRVWRPYASETWARAGFTVDQTLLDVGCGPGYATVDLAEIVGSGGRIVALERSERFLAVLETMRRTLALSNIDAYRVDLDVDPLPDVRADGAWCRWIFAFARDPRALLHRVADRLKRDGVIALHEYFAYDLWRLSPRSPEHEEFVRHVVESWRASGGEPDVGLMMLAWLADAGFRILSVRPIVHVITPDAYMWQWPKAFVETGLRRLVDLGRIAPDGAERIAQAFAASERTPNVQMVTPGVLEIIAVRT